MEVLSRDDVAWLLACALESGGECGLRFAAQILGVEPCERCDYAKSGCCCHPRGED